MYTRADLLAAVNKEFAILKHLGNKVNEANKKHKLTDNQRSIEELEHYIISSLPAQVKLMVLGKRDNEIYTAYTSQFPNFGFDKFAEELDNALVTITKDLESLSDAQWHEEIALRGMSGPRTKYLVDYLLAFLGAYKMQLFLQLKHAGLHELNTYNLWGGIDEPK